MKTSHHFPRSKPDHLQNLFIKLSLSLAAFLFIASLTPASVSAAPGFRVNSSGDGADAAINGVCETASGNGVCTLRAAIQEAIANANTAIGITFGIPTTDPGYNAQTGAWTINLSSALPDLNKSSRLEATTLSIIGPGADLLTIQKTSGFATDFRIFNVTTTGTVNISGVTITRGTGGVTSGSGGGVQNAGSGTVNISSCVLRNNSAAAPGGAVANSSTGIVAIINSTLENNAARFDGGAIYSDAGALNVTGSLIRGNFSASGRGGGISARGAVSIINTTIADNVAISPNWNLAAEGGGIFVYGTASLVNSTISGNLARGTDATVQTAGTGEALGGGVYGTGNINITNCTIAANFAEGGTGFYSLVALGKGGGIFYSGGGTLNLSNSTVSGNSAKGGYNLNKSNPGFGGGILNAGAINIKSTIVANNLADFSGPDVSGAFASQGFNFIGKQDGSTGFVLATDKKGTIARPLDPKFDVKGLRNNGGLTETIALQPSSPAVDKGSSVGLTGTLTTDQRGAGFVRTVDRAPGNANGGDGTDIGAFELAP
jgi:hypothetical protein